MNLVSAEYHRTAGLGNKLFPWARAKVLGARLGCGVKATRWFSPRGAALVRGGVNYRTAFSKIWLMGNFHPDPSEIGWSEFNRRYRMLSLSFLGLLPEPDWKPEMDVHYVFGWGNHYFSDLWTYREYIKECFLKITEVGQSGYLRSFEGRDFIALNIRTGKDFKTIDSGVPGYYMTDLEWFADALGTIRRTHGNMQAFIVSDGGEKQLGKILSMENVSLVDTRTATADLRILLNAKVLLGSGNSSFSAWASFLGGMDTYSSAATPFDGFSITGPGSPQVVATL